MYDSILKYYSLLVRPSNI